MKKIIKKDFLKFMSKFAMADIRLDDITSNRGNVIRRIYNKNNKVIAIIINWEKYWITGE